MDRNWDLGILIVGESRITQGDRLLQKAICWLKTHPTSDLWSVSLVTEEAQLCVWLSPHSASSNIVMITTFLMCTHSSQPRTAWLLFQKWELRYRYMGVGPISQMDTLF